MSKSVIKSKNTQNETMKIIRELAGDSVENDNLGCEIIIETIKRYIGFGIENAISESEIVEE